jgi:hypothetical protein
MRAGPVGVALTALPVAVVAAATLWIAAGEWRGRNALAAPPFRNSAEAAAAGDAPAALRFLRMGDNPSLIHPIRGDIISADVRSATTLEAALWSRHIEMIRVLDREGAIVDADQRRELACLALDLDLPDVAEYLAPGQVCVKGDALRRVVARSRPEIPASSHD